MLKLCNLTFLSEIPLYHLLPCAYYSGGMCDTHIYIFSEIFCYNVHFIYIYFVLLIWIYLMPYISLISLCTLYCVTVHMNAWIIFLKYLFIHYYLLLNTLYVYIYLLDTSLYHLSTSVHYAVVMLVLKHCFVEAWTLKPCKHPRFIMFHCLISDDIFPSKNTRSGAILEGMHATANQELIKSA